MGIEEVIKNLSNASSETSSLSWQNREGKLQESISRNLLPELEDVQIPQGETDITKKIEDFTPQDFGINQSETHPVKRPWDESWGRNVHFGENKELCQDELNELEHQYNKEVADNSAAGKVDETRITDWEKIPSDDLADKRREYQSQKSYLVKEWEENNGQPWPRYDEDYYNGNGNLIAREGDAFDAHHIQPLEFGGDNSAENLTPMHKKDHHDRQGVHRPDSPYDDIAKHLRTI